MAKIVENKQKKKKENIFQKLLELRDDIREEFDLLELVEDSIKDVFECDLDCSTCSVEEQGICMQNFKKANIFWLRKIAQDEWMLKDIAEKVGNMGEILEQQIYELKGMKGKLLGERVGSDDYESSDIDQYEQKQLNDKKLNKIDKKLREKPEEQKLIKTETIYS